MREKRRICFLDVLRAAAFLGVFFYHYLVRLAEYGICSPQRAERIYQWPNFHIATLSVSLFFILSGAGLMLSGLGKWDIKKYFKKRMLRIYLPYYVSYIGIFLAMFLIKGGKVFETTPPLWYFVYTIVGVDGYLEVFGIETFSLGVGEWFLGCLLIIYLLFPLLRKLFLKRGTLVMVIATVGYFFLVLSDGWNIPVHLNFGAKLYEFMLGMYWALHREKIRNWCCGISAIVLGVFVFYPQTLILREGLRITVFAAAVFLCVSGLEHVFAKMQGLERALKEFRKYSFEMYLVHHWVIIMVTKVFAKVFASQETSWLLPAGLFIMELMITVCVAAVVRNVVSEILKRYRKPRYS